MRAGLVLHRRTVAAVASVAALLGVVYLVVPDPVAQYAAWLVVFTVWMTWFVLTGIEWLSTADG